jgi:predicted MFS family arabinose efflux permease
MTANGLSPFDAAARLLVFGAPVVVGSGLTGILLGRLKLRPVLVIAAGAALQLIGAALLARSSLEYHVHASQYAYQVLIGLGLGLVMPALIYLLPYTMEKQDLGENDP